MSEPGTSWHQVCTGRKVAVEFIELVRVNVVSGVQRIVGHGVAPEQSASGDHGGRRTQRWVLGPIGFPLAAGALIALVIVSLSVSSGVVYHAVVYENFGTENVWLVRRFVAIGALVAFLYLLPFAFRGEFRVDRFLDNRPPITRLIMTWSYAFVALAIVAFLTKTTATFSRGWLLLFYASGVGAMPVLEIGLRRMVGSALAGGRISRRRLMLIGLPEEIQRFTLAATANQSTAEVASVVAIPASVIAAVGASTEPLLSDILDRAAVSARAHEIDCIVLLTDLNNVAFVDHCVAAFSMLPVSIHLDAGRLAERFNGISIGRIGPVAALALTEAPLGPLQTLAKRSFDFVVAGCALLGLWIAFTAIAILIKLDSPGPVFFRQRRLGFNQREFLIYKFRSMSVMDDGANISQAQHNDPRVTRVGQYLRRYNLDELPQLINVLRGEMSLVGPRPHAVAHDRLFEKRIGRYPRRLNVKPGITGWAQVHGFRGETDTDAKMQARVEYDLYYIDNWSLWLDIYIMGLTVVSPAAYRNAH